MKSNQELENIERFVKSTHNNYANKLIVDDSKPYDPEHSQLGYCFKYEDDASGVRTYYIVCAPIGDKDVDYRVYMHEIGHIYLGHLDGIDSEMDTLLSNSIRDDFYEIAERINKECGIDFGESLLKRIVDDPYVNHSFHNISMDMEVNSKVLSDEGIHFMEAGVTKVLPKKMEEALKVIADKTDDPELKAKVDDELKKMENETKIKFILPSKYHTNEIGPDGNPKPFPNGLSYVEYLLLMLKYADQFVKMLVSLKDGGDGDTSKVTQQQIQNALNQWWNQQSQEYKDGYNQAMQDIKNGQAGQQNEMQGQQGEGGNQNSQGKGQQCQGNGQSQGNGQQGQGNGQAGQQGQSSGASSPQGGNGQGMSDFDRGYQDALRDAAEGLTNGQGQQMRGLDSLMSKMGMAPDPGEAKGEGREQLNRDSCPYNDLGKPQNNGVDGDKDFGKDHFTNGRREADKLREQGLAGQKGGIGCGKEGGADKTISTEDKMVDSVDSAINEIMRNIKHRSIKVSNRRDVMRRYNRGIQRDVIAPTISQKINLCSNPKIVFLLDVSGSMDARLIQRIIKTISFDLHKINRGLRYDIIAWNTRLSQHIKDIDPKKSIPEIRCGGGTEMADGIKYFAEQYNKDAILVLISDFEDSLERWHEEENKLSGYDIYAWNYGRYTTSQEWTRLKQRDFSDYGYTD